MKLTAQQVIDATLTVSQIIRERRPMPQIGKLRLARMHAKLLPEFEAINARRDEMITAYDTHQTTTSEDPETHEMVTQETAEFVVPPDKMTEFNAAWKLIADAELEIDVQPVRLIDLDLGEGNGGIEAGELIVLGELVTE